MTISEIEYGSIASSKKLNDNFNALNKDIQDLATSLNTTNANLATSMSTLNKNVTNQISEVNESLANKKKELEETISKTKSESNSFFSENGLFVTTYINGASCYKEYFSDSEKKTRVWLEQGGVLNSRSSTTYIKSFANNNYTLLLGTHCTYYEGGGISGKSTSGFSHHNGKGWSYDVEWYACGK